MSETTSAAPSGDSGAPESAPAPASSDFAAIGQQLEQEGLLPSRTSDDPPESPDDDEDSEPKLRLKINGKFVDKPRSEVIAMAQKYEAGEAKLETAKREI